MSGARTAGAALAAALAALAAAPGVAAADAWQWRVDAERWNLPAGEAMGMTRLAVRRQVAPWLAVGLDGGAAVRGSRGGFITLGFGGEVSVPLAPRWDAEAGLALGAGGGRGGYQLSGGGLLLRGHAGLRYRLTASDAVTAGISRVDFPNGGTIRSTEAYVGFLHGFETADADAAVTPGAATGRLSLYVEPLRVDRGVHRVDGTSQPDFGLVGAQWRTQLQGGLYARLAAAGAATGSSSGYMQAMAGLGYRWPLAPRLAAQAAVSVGAGGGGGVDTGGGFLAEAAAGVAFDLARNASLELEFVRRRAPSAAFAADGLTLRVGHRFGAAEDAPPTARATTPALHPVRIRFLDEQYRGASAAWSARPNREFGTLGVAADYFVTKSLFVTGQGLAAYSGQNGAYMIGLAGAGWQQPLGAGFHAEAELLAGAAGGGGTAVGSGTVGQLNASIGWQSPRGLGLSLGVGRLEARRGGFAANVVGLAVSWRTIFVSHGD